MSKYTFTSESVSEGHPDKVCDAISDAVLDNLLSQDPESHVACETMATTGTVIVSGEVRSNGFIDVEKIVKNTLEEIGYTDKAYGMDNKEVKVISMLDEQSPEIAQGVDQGSGLHEEQGAGDQGLMFGFACDETKELMPLPIHLSHRLVERMTDLRKNGTISWLRPDSKSQVSVAYEDDKPISVTKVVIATQHDDMINKFGDENAEHDFVEKEIITQVIRPVLDECGLPYDESFIVNGTGRFVFGGPEADTGLTGRKIIVDTYGGYAPHGGGAFSGKDPSKVDRSAAYMARYVAKNCVAAGLCKEMEIQLAYAIGVAEPVSIKLNTFGTSELSNDLLLTVIKGVFGFKPREIIETLNLLRPIYQKSAVYGHFGRSDVEFPWEALDKVQQISEWKKKLMATT